MTTNHIVANVYRFESLFKRLYSETKLKLNLNTNSDPNAHAEFLFIEIEGK